jgi:preprotein translocase subunit SecF
MFVNTERAKTDKAYRAKAIARSERVIVVSVLAMMAVIIVNVIQGDFETLFAALKMMGIVAGLMSIFVIIVFGTGTIVDLLKSIPASFRSVFKRRR